ncbi:Ankyrin-2 [Dactylellina cionopaga]|nr:Ankyrin-2 [Dactylellina cionopaga]
MEADYDILIHENYDVGVDSEETAQKSTKAPYISNVAGLVSLALSLGVPVLRDSGNATIERASIAAGASSRASVFKLQGELIEIAATGAAYGGKLVVSKHLPKGYVENESQRYDALVRDILFLSHAPIREHDNFVKIVAIGWEDAENVAHTRIWPVLILEFAEYGTLEDFFKLDDTDKSWDSKNSICIDVAAALSWLHDCRIVHSDIKPGNVLISRNQRSDKSVPYQAKISDFGFALDIDALEASGRETAVLDGFTPPCAPEVGSEIPLALLTKVDVFSYGLLVGRVFLDGDQIFSEAPRITSFSPRDVMDEFERKFKRLGIHEHPQIDLVRNIIGMTTLIVPESRSSMKDALDAISNSAVRTTSSQTSQASSVEEQDQLIAVLKIEDVWALGLYADTRRTIFADLLQTLQSYIRESQETESKEQELSSNIAYQLYLAHLIGFGCEESTEKALDYLHLSARLGSHDAQKEKYGNQAALSVMISSTELEEIIHWLTEAAMQGDKSCLQELRSLDGTAYETIVASADRRRILCERSGFIFSSEFIEINNLDDVGELISAILESGDPIDVDIGGGLTWLHYAVFMDNLEMASRLIEEFNFPVNVQNSKGQTPLWIACLSGNYEISTYLISRGADAGIESNTGSNPLHHLPVFEDRHVENIASLLVEHGANINGQNALGYTPLHYAVSGSGNLEEEPSVSVLLRLGGNPLLADNDGDTALDSALYAMRVSYLEMFLESQSVKAVSATERNKILANAFGNWVRQMKHHRIRSGSSKYLGRIRHLVQLLHTDEVVFEYIINHPAGFTPLHDAYAFSSSDLASEIIRLPNAHLDELDTGRLGYTPLMVAIRNCSLAVIQDLLQAGANPLVRARTGENVLHHCVQYNPDLLPYICDQVEKRHCDTEIFYNQSTFRKGETPLDYAIFKGRSDIVRFLLAKGTNPDCMRQSHENGDLKLNSFRYCLFPPSIRMFEILLPYMQRQSFICASNGMNLLHFASMHVYDANLTLNDALDIIEAKSGDALIAPFINKLIEYFPTAIATTFGSNATTSLHLAAASGNVTAVKILLQRGANPFTVDAQGDTPIDQVTDDGQEIVDIDGNVIQGILRQQLLTRWREIRQILWLAMKPSTR